MLRFDLVVVEGALSAAHSGSRVRFFAMHSGLDRNDPADVGAQGDAVVGYIPNKPGCSSFRPVSGSGGAVALVPGTRFRMGGAEIGIRNQETRKRYSTCSGGLA